VGNSERWGVLIIRQKNEIKSSTSVSPKGFKYITLSVFMMLGGRCTSGQRYAAYTGVGDTEYYLSGIVISVLAAMFGAVHCVSWSFVFPSFTLKTMWRVCSMFITFSPLVLALLSAIVWSLLKFRVRSATELLRMHVATGGLTAYCLAPLYIFARVILLVVAVCCLSTIPTTGHQSVEWGDFIPHI
jgi:hypothetical protein